MGDHPVQAAHAAAARPEHVHRTKPDGLDDTVVVLGMHSTVTWLPGSRVLRSMPPGS